MLGKAVHREVSHWRHSATKPPEGRVAGGGCWPLNADGAKHLMVQKLRGPQEPGTAGAKPAAEACRASTTEPESKPLSFRSVSPVPSIDKA